MVVSVFYLDLGGVFVFELGRYSYKSNSLLVLEFIYLSTLLTYLLLYKSFYRNGLIQSLSLSCKRSSLYLSPKFIKIFLIFSLIFIFINLAHMFYSGVPIFLGFGKGQFWAYAAIPAFNILHNQITTILLVLGFLYAYIKYFQLYNIKYTKLLKYFKVILFLNLIYIVLMGYKFGGPLQCLFSFYISTLVFYSIGKNFKITVLLKYVIAFLLLIVPIILYTYYYILNVGDGALQLIIDRVFALQGQVWHFVFNEVNDGKILLNDAQFFIEFENSFLNNAHEYSGINNLMQLIMPEARLNSYLEGGVRLSGGYPANLFTMFDNWLLIFFVHMFFSLAIFVFHMKFIKHLCQLNLVRFVLWFKLALLSEGFLFMGDLNTIISIKTIFYLFVLIMIEMILKTKGPRALKEIV